MARIIQKDPLSEISFKRLPYTAFLPNDAAFEGFNGTTDLDFINAHISKSPILIQNAADAGAVTSDMTGNPDLFITKVPNGKRSILGYEDNDYYVNNARVISANIKAESDDNKKQILHIIDGVLAPTRAVDGASGVGRYPTAGDVLKKFRSFGIHTDNPKNSIELFAERVENLDQMEDYETEGPNTYFIPIDSAIESSSQVMDRQVIHGHIVQGRSLFTRPSVVLEEKKIKSVAFYDNLKVLLEIEEVRSKNTTGYYVKSHTIASDLAHPKGTALARIVKANIPVANGVVHLIDRPLMTTADSIKSYLQEAGQLSQFYELFKEHQPTLLQRLVSDQELTLFAPSNYAFSRVMQSSLNKTIPNARKLEELLKLHMIPQRLSSDAIIRQSKNAEYSVPTLSSSRQLYFSTQDDDPKRQPTIYVQGAGVNSTITTHDIIAKNGYIHIIDRVLDIPSQTIYEKLQSSPLLRTTFEMSVQAGFQEDFDDREKRFTMFVPNNDAWEHIMRTMPSAYKKLTLKEFAYHVKQILQRHLIINKTLSIKSIDDITSNRTLSPSNPDYHELHMMRGMIYFEPTLDRTHNEYTLHWKGIEATVKQPDVECVNGVIHIIDAVMMSRHDVTVSGADGVMGSFLTPLPLLLLAFLLR